MILQRDIIKIAQSEAIPKSTIEKDWVLGHFVDSIFQQRELSNSLVFKGGTCLRKCWFNNYRFSEDLDFTSLDANFKLTETNLQSICVALYDSIGLSTSIESIKELQHKDKPMGFQALVRYWGPDHSGNKAPPVPEKWQTKIKFEITLNEFLVFNPIMKKIHHPYPDELIYNQAIPCYVLEEVIAEKLRALILRSYTAPRDFYDIWYILKNNPEIMNVPLKAAFIKKLKFKGHDYIGIEQLFNEHNNKSVERAWDTSLGHQIKKNNLPSFTEVLTFLESMVQKILNQ